MRTISAAELQKRLSREDNLVSVIERHRESTPNPEANQDKHSPLPGNGTSDTAVESQRHQTPEILTGANLPLESHPAQSPTLVESLPPQGSEEHRIQHKPGRDVGDSNVPDFLRKIIAQAANTPGTTTGEVALAFGVSHHQTHDYKHGRVNDRPNEGLQKAVNDTRKKVHDKALDRVMTILNLFDEDAMSMLEPKDMARAAHSLTKVAEAMAPKSDNPFGESQVIIYAPEIRNFENYEVIQVAPDNPGK